MLERLNEYWLDSANERGYQPAFVQMLVSEGHRVLHSTRHSTLEYGKDVITIAPDKVPCAYQLKGNPGGRLTKTQLGKIRPQLDELVTQAISYPGVPNVRHRSYLVTNGLVEEEVQRAIGDLNRTWKLNGYGDEALLVLTRGDLLERANTLGAALWPLGSGGVADIGALVELMSHSGADMLPLGKVHTLLSTMYGFDSRKTAPRGPKLAETVTSAALLTAVATRNFSQKENHWAVASAWILFACYTIAACERARTAPKGKIKGSVAAARTAIFNALSDLAVEASGRATLSEGSSWVDTEFYHARLALVRGILSAYWLWCRRDGWTPPELAAVEAFIPRELDAKGLWGEAAWPALLAHYWCASRRDPTSAPENSLARLVGTLLNRQLADGAIPLASPYYGIDDVVRHRRLEFLGSADDPFDDRSFKQSSCFAEGLLHLLVRSNLKQHCKMYWSDYTRLGHRRFKPEKPWQYCTVHSERGIEHDTHVPSAGDWAALQEAASRCDTPTVPTALRADPVLLLLLTLVLPQRATPDVVRFLGAAFSEQWFLPQPKPTLGS